MMLLRATTNDRPVAGHVLMSLNVSRFQERSFGFACMFCKDSYRNQDKGPGDIAKLGQANKLGSRSGSEVFGHLLKSGRYHVRYR